MAEPKNERRELDTTNASMDIHALNNVVVSLRGLMKKVQLFTIQKLVRQSKQLLLMNKGAEEFGLKKQRKAERLVSEVGTIKELKIDHAVKYALANTRTFGEVAAKADLETRAKVRLATHPLMVAKVEKWRKEHNDWQALAAFIMYKNTGRRFKKKKKKDKAKMSTDSINDSNSKVSVKANENRNTGNRIQDLKRKSKEVSKIGDGLSAKELARKAKTTQKESFIEKKAKQLATVNEREEIKMVTKDFEGEKSEGESVSDSDQIETSDDSDNGSSEAEKEENKVYQEGQCIKESSEIDRSSKEDRSESSDEDSHGDNISLKEVETNTKKETTKTVQTVLKSKSKAQTQVSEDESSESDEKSYANKICSTLKSNYDRKKSTTSTTKLPKPMLKCKKLSHSKEGCSSDHDETTKSSKPIKQQEPTKTVAKEVKPKPKPVGYNAGKEMAIKKIDLKSLSDDVEDIPVDKKAGSDVSFLFSSAVDIEVGKHKSKGKKKDTFFSVDGEEDDEDDDNDMPEGNVRERHYDSDGHGEIQRRMCHKNIESAFVGRLSDKQAKGDWGDGRASFRGRRDRSRGGSSGGHGRRGFLSDRAGSRIGFSGDRNHSGYGQGSWRSENCGMEDDSRNKRKMPAADEGNLHPSWEAKRLKKERENKIAEFQGTKIKFDD